MSEQATGAEQVRAAEVIASLCLAIDLGMAFPFEHGLQAALTTMRLCDALGLDSETASHTYYVALLLHVGCTVEADLNSRIFHSNIGEGQGNLYGSPFKGATAVVGAIPDPEADWPTRAGQLATGIPRAVRFRVRHFTAYCEAATMMADGVGLPPTISSLLALVLERWDGWSHLRRAKGDEIPLPLRIAHVCTDATFQRLLGDDEYVVATIGDRRGHAFDPDIAEVFVKNASDILGTADPVSVWDEVLDAEPKPRLYLQGKAIDRALGTMGAFSDLASPYLTGHASGVGELAARAGELLGLTHDEVRDVRRAGYVHDVGRAGVHPRIWSKSGTLSADDWEQVRLHPYHTERVFFRSGFLAPLAKVACEHHERLDGSGYHRGLGAATLGAAARLLAAADAFHSKIQPRAYRSAFSIEEAAGIVVSKAHEGKLDPEMVSAVVEAAGQKPPRLERPAGLTEREVDVVAMLARGRQTKQVARALGISIKTADRHIQNAYRKMGVSTRVGATLFATEHGLVTLQEPGRSA